jgi:serine/threonine-protein kinase
LTCLLHREKQVAEKNVSDLEITTVRRRPPERHPVGGTLGGHPLLQRIGSGGMGRVDLSSARVDGTPQLVALKRPLPHASADPILRALFVAEARTLARLCHPNLAGPVQTDSAASRGYFTMELVDGWTLTELVRAAVRVGAAIPVGVTLAIAKSICRGLHALHETRDERRRRLELVHGDISPSNVMITREGEVKLIDFGLTQSAHAPPIKRQGFLGTAGYMSPEQVERGRVDRTSDIFSLGIILWELSTQCRLFRANDAAESAARIVAGDIPWPSEVRPGFCEALERIVMRTLSLDVQERYETAMRLELVLDRYARGEAIRATRSVLAQWVREVDPDGTFTRSHPLPRPALR